MALLLLLVSAFGIGLSAGVLFKYVMRWPTATLDCLSLAVAFCFIAWVGAGRIVVQSYPWENQGWLLFWVLFSGLLAVPGFIVPLIKRKGGSNDSAAA